jgi:S1-C subfamily serine protease
VAIGYRRGNRAGTITATLAKLGVSGKKIVTDEPPDWRGIRVEYATALDAASLGEQTAAGAIDPEGCVLVANVAADSAAWRAGVRSGMFISHVGPVRVTTPQEFRDAVEATSGPVTVRLTQAVRQLDQRESTEIKIP